MSASHARVAVRRGMPRTRDSGILGQPLRATLRPELTATRAFVPRHWVARGPKRAQKGRFREYALLRLESLSARPLGALARPSRPTPRAALTANGTRVTARSAPSSSPCMQA